MAKKHQYPLLFQLLILTVSHVRQLLQRLSLAHHKQAHMLVHVVLRFDSEREHDVEAKSERRYAHLTARVGRARAKLYKPISAHSTVRESLVDKYLIEDDFRYGNVLFVSFK